MDSPLASPYYGVARQMQIYLAGMQKKKPELPIAFEDLEQKARETMKPEAFGYIYGGAGGGSSILNNLNAFKKWEIVPKMLVDISRLSIKTTFLGREMAAPIILAPIGVLSIAHPDAEVAVARAAAALQIPFALSTVSSKALEEVAGVSGDGQRFFQLYWGKSREFTQSLIKRAEIAGYSALMVTLDTRMLAWREKDIEQAYLPFFLGEGLANFFSDPVFRAMLKEAPEKNPLAAIMQFGQIFTNPELTWEDVKSLRDQTKLPIFLKGILHPDDARKALDYGVEGIIVSNHGGRQVDGSVAALEMLPEIAEIAGDQTTILFDSGIRRGADVFKAIALGAKAVLLGRPFAYGLALAGEAGIKHVVQNLMADADLTLGLSGGVRWADIGRHNLRKAV